MNKDLQDIVFSEIVTIRDRLLRTASPLRLESGEPSFDTPAHIKEAMSKALMDNETHYAPSTGILPLREAIVRKLESDNKISYLSGPDDITITNGGMQALFVALRTILNPGDEVIIPRPNWPATARMIEFVGSSVRPVPLKPELGFKWDLDELEAAITPNCKAILVNYPHNPTGAVATREDMAEILKFAERHKLYIISDEAYEHIVYESSHVSVAAVASDFSKEVQDRIFSCFTFSKTYAMTGWRLGYAVCTDPKICKIVKKAELYTTNGVSTPTQYAGIAALEGSQDCVTEMCDVYKERRDLLFDGVNRSEFLRCQSLPSGAFYLYAKVTDNWKGSARELVEHFIDKHCLGSAPGEAFLEQNKMIRLSYACDTEMIKKAVVHLAAPNEN